VLVFRVEERAQDVVPDRQAGPRRLTLLHFHTRSPLHYLKDSVTAAMSSWVIVNSLEDRRSSQLAVAMKLLSMDYRFANEYRESF